MAPSAFRGQEIGQEVCDRTAGEVQCRDGRGGGL